MSRQSLPLTDDLYRYLLQASLRETELQQRLREETAKLPQANMQIAPEQGQFMGLLARLINARLAIEVGVFTGYSSLWLAQALPADGRLIACDTSTEWTAIARRYWQEAGVAQKIDLRLAPALQTLDELLAAGQQAHYDFVFIDADKTNYRNYYERALALLRPGGLILLDNTLWGGKVADAGAQDRSIVAIRELNAYLKNDERIWLSLLPIADGLTLAIKKEHP